MVDGVPFAWASYNSIATSDIDQTPSKENPLYLAFSAYWFDTERLFVVTEELDVPLEEVTEQE